MVGIRSMLQMLPRQDLNLFCRGVPVTGLTSRNTVLTCEYANCNECRGVT